MRSSFKIFSVLLILGVLSGCALTTTQVPSKYSPAATGMTIHSPHTIAIQVKDTRGVDPLLFGHKRNGFNMKMNGKFVAQKPISELLQTSFAQALGRDGLRIVSRNSNMTLSGELSTLELRPIMGFTIDLLCKIHVNFTLRDNNTGAKLWSHSITGTGVDKNLPFVIGDNVQTAFNQATDNLVQQLEASNGFRRALNR